MIDSYLSVFARLSTLPAFSGERLFNGTVSVRLSVPSTDSSSDVHVVLQVVGYDATRHCATCVLLCFVDDAARLRSGEGTIADIGVLLR